MSSYLILYKLHLGKEKSNDTKCLKQSNDPVRVVETGGNYRYSVSGSRGRTLIEQGAVDFNYSLQRFRLLNYTK